MRSTVRQSALLACFDCVPATRHRPFLLLALAIALVSASAGDALATRGSRYITSGLCGSVPAVALRVAKGFCVGLAATGLGLPRGVLPLADGRVLVTDLGRWDAATGRLLILIPKPGSYESRPILKGLDRPHGLQTGPDGQVYLAEAGRILRVNLERSPPTATPVITGLPNGGRHPLKQFVFGPDGAIYVNVGASTDHCEDAPSPRGMHCPEAEREAPGAAIWRYALANGKWVGAPFARGLRNAMALAFAPDGSLWQAENSRDTLPDGGDSETLPHDELNRIRPGAHYGWPYCTDMGRLDPRFAPGDCKRFAKPERLLPAHSAPLGMAFYTHAAAPNAWRGSLVIGLHGYRRQGHRIIAWPFDTSGRPARQFRVLVDGWQTSARHPLGAPTDIKVDTLGRLWMTEDRNGTLLVIRPE